MLPDAPKGPHIKRLTSGLWELRTAHRVLGVYRSKDEAKAARTRLLKRGRRCYHTPVHPQQGKR